MSARPQLSTPLALSAPVRVADGSGGFSQSWQTLGTLWAELTPRGGALGKAEAGPVARSRLRIVTRATPPGDPARPIPGQRLVGGGETYLIRAVEPHDRAGLYLSCLVETEVLA